MVIHNPCNESCPISQPLFQSLVQDASERPVKFKSVSQFYSEAKPETWDEFDSSTESDSLELQEWSDSDDATKPVKKRRVSLIEKQNVADASPQKEAHRGFKTLAQLLEPGRNERIKTCPRRKRECSSRSMANKVKRYYYGSRVRANINRRSNGRMLTGNIGLIVDLVFQRDAIDDGLSSSNYPLQDATLPEDLPAEDSLENGSVSLKLLPSALNGKDLMSHEPTQTEDELKPVIVKDPLSLKVARSFGKHIKSVQPSPLFSSHLKWREVDVGEVDPSILLNRKCKVYYPSENNWSTGFINEYNVQNRKHLIKYENDQRWHCLTKERIALHISLDEKVNLIVGHTERSFFDGRKDVAEELLVFATSTENFDRVFEHGDIVWAATPGYPMWPAFIMDEQHARRCGLDVPLCPDTLAVHFFGTHDSFRVKDTRIVRFSKGLFENYHLKCFRVSFDCALEQAHRYLKEQKLPEPMAYLHEDVVDTSMQEKHSEDESEDDEDFVGDERKHKVRKSLASIFKCPIKLGSLRVLSLGKIVKDSEYFHDQHYIWTEGYTSVRKFFSMKDPTKMVNYKMEIVRNPNARTMPLFRVIPDDWEQHRWKVQVLQPAGRRFLTSCRELEPN